MTVASIKPAKVDAPDFELLEFAKGIGLEAGKMIEKHYGMGRLGHKMELNSSTEINNKAP